MAKSSRTGLKFVQVGLDTSKGVFQVHGIAEDSSITRRRLRRAEVERYFANLPPTLIGMEACGAAHYWARLLVRLGHQVRLIPPQYIKPYVKRGKNDVIDAEAICEALSRPTMRFVPIKTEEQQAGLALVGVRALILKQRTMLANAVRGHAAEFGLVAAKGIGHVGDLLERIATKVELPSALRLAIRELGVQLAQLDECLDAVTSELELMHKQSPLSQRLATTPGVGPITAITVTLKVPDPDQFKSGEHFAAWTGVTPRLHSTAGRDRHGGISRAGDETLRALLVNGATSVIKNAKPGRSSQWLLDLIERKPPKVAAVALANKMARTLWAMMKSGETYRSAKPKPQTAVQVA